MRLIDADAFLERVLPECKYPEILKEAVENQSTIEAEPVRHGEWERHSFEQIECLESGVYRILSTAQCSVCRRWAEHVDDIEKIVTYDVCPKCGARMDSQNEARYIKRTRQVHNFTL